MLPTTERLRKKGLFQRVYTARKVVANELFTLHVLPKLPRSSVRMPLAGFVVGKKVHAKACQRNLAKRRVREAYRILRQELATEGKTSKDALNLEQWYAIVFVVQAKMLEAKWEEIKISVRHSLQKANEKFGGKRAPQRNS